MRLGLLVGDWGVWVRERVPVGDQPDMSDPKIVAAACSRVADLLKDPDRYGATMGVVVLRRPGPTRLTSADRRILRLISKAAAKGDTGMWSFFIAGLQDFLPVLRPEEKAAPRR